MESAAQSGQMVAVSVQPEFPPAIALQIQSDDSAKYVIHSRVGRIQQGSGYAEDGSRE